MLRIEPVRPEDEGRAVEALAGRDGAAERRAAFEAMVSGPDAARCALWWARSFRRVRAAALAMRNAGRTATIFHSPAADSDPAALPALLEALTEATLATHVTFVQALLRPQARADAHAFLQAGYMHLARLMYLQRELAGASGAPPPGDVRPPASELTWPTLGRGDEEHLGRVIADTYVDSQDCPALLGLRPMSDVIAAHKSSGIFRPQWWWMPAAKGECVGCVLINEVIEAPDSADVVYLGVRPGWRRRGFARTMIRRAYHVTAAAGMKTMHLAVDSSNTAAVRLYGQEGFHEVDRKDVYIRPAGPDQRAPG